MPIPTLGPDDLFALEFLRDAHLRADGRVAYVVSSIEDDAERFEIRIAGPDGKPIGKVPFAGAAHHPRWSPSGEVLAFIADGRLATVETADLGSLRFLSPQDKRAQGAPCWSPDGDLIAVSLREQAPTSANMWISDANYRAEGSGLIAGLSQHVWVASHADGACRPITGVEDGLCSQHEWSADGRRLLCFATRDAVPVSSYSPRLLIIDLVEDKCTHVLDDSWYLTAARWMPDGRIAIAGARASELSVPNASLWVVDALGGHEPRMPHIAGKIGGMLHHDMPCWELSRGNPIIILDEDTAIVTILRRGAFELWRTNLSGPIDAERILVGDRSCIGLAADPARDRLLFAATDLGTPPELYLSSLGGSGERRVTRLNDEILADWPAVVTTRLDFVTEDGLQVDAWFMAGEGTIAPMPTVLYIHGGPFAATGQIFRYDFHLLASRGYGIVFANFRGSAGYGDEFSRAIQGDWGGLGFPDHIATVDHAVDAGLADPDRLGVWGASHGGFATCWVVGHCDRFRAAVAEAAPTDFASWYRLTDAYETIARDLGGRPHDIPEIYAARSPISFAHLCTTPLMFIHGSDDVRVPISEAEQMYRVLHDVGCLTALVRLEGGDHLCDSSGPIECRREQNRALVAWFERHL